MERCIARSPTAAGALGVLLLLWLACASIAAGAESTVWELTPYRVQVVVAAPLDPAWTARLQSDLIAALSARIDSTFAPLWDATVVACPKGLRGTLLADLESVAVESLPPAWLDFDKLALLVASDDRLGMRVRVRELDLRTRQWGRVVEIPVGQAAKLCDGGLRALRQAFAPLARVETVEKKDVALRLRAGALAPRDQGLTWIAAGSVFQPVIRRNDREGKLRGVLVPPWTFLSVNEVSASEVKCRMYQGIASPLATRKRGRIEQLALHVAPRARPTRIVLRARTAPKGPLPGYDFLEQSLDGKSGQWLGRSDWRGSLLLRPSPQPLRVLLVRHGDETLARLPVVPGLYEELTASLPNDEIRLEVERAITDFQEVLVDLVTRRQLLLVRGRASLKAKKFDQVEAVVRELHTLEQPEQLQLRLDRLKTQKRSNDAAIQRRIDAMLADTQKILQTHASTEAIEELVRQLAAARATP